MRCPNCGAENTERAIYCASCAADLKERASIERLEDVPAQLPPGPARIMEFSNRQFKGFAIMFLIVGILHVLEIAMGEAGTLDWVVAVGSFAIAIGTLVFWRRLESRGGTTTAVLRYLTYEPGPSDRLLAHTASSMNMVAVPVLVVFAMIGGVFLALAVYILDSSSSPMWVIAAVMAAAILGTVLFTAFRGRSEVALSEDGLWFNSHTPFGGFTLHFKRSDLAALEIDGRVLRVVLKDPPYGMFRGNRHILLGDRRKREEFAQAVNAYGLAGSPPA